MDGVEQVLQDYDTAYGLKSVCLRYFNAAGADPEARIGKTHEPETHLIPLLLQVASGCRQSAQIYGDDYDTPDGTCIRDYIHVFDLAAVHSLAMPPRRAGDPARLVADSTLARRHLAWIPSYSDLCTIVSHAWNWERKIAAV